MRKVTKILLKALSVTVLFLIFCPIVLTLLVSLPSVQNFVVDRAVKYLSRKLETTVSIDRIRLGYVIDFFYFRLIDFPIFNVADCYVVGACIVFALLVLFYYREEEDFSFLSREKKG